MKIHLTKKGMTRYCQPEELELMQSAGWREAAADKVQAGDVVIRLKPPVKSKATVTAVEEANITNKGDE
jgi:hypothetical protein